MSVLVVPTVTLSYSLHRNRSAVKCDQAAVTEHVFAIETVRNEITLTSLLLLQHLKVYFQAVRSAVK